MSDVQQTLKIAIGLTRRAITLLESVGRSANAGHLRATIAEVLEANPWLRGEEMSPEDACLAAGIPLSGEMLAPLEEVDVPPELEMPSPHGTKPMLIWPVAG